jgi:hypothetical protein
MLIREDLRTPEGIGRDRQHEAEMKTRHLFASSSTAE